MTRCVYFLQSHTLTSAQHNYVGSFEFQMEIKIICRSPFPFADHANFGDLTLLLFCRASLRNVQSFKKHELSNRFAY